MADNSSPASYTKKYVEGEMVIAGWGIVAKGIGFINTILVLSSLSVYQYGVFQLLLSAYGFFNGFAGLGVSFAGMDVSRAMGVGNEARAKRVYLQMHGTMMLFSIILAGIFYFGTQFIPFEYDASFLEFFKILAFMFISGELISFVKKLMIYRLDFATFARRSSIQKVVQCGILLYFLFFEDIGIREVLLSLVISSYVSVLFLIKGAIRAYKPWRNVSAERGRVFWKLFRAHGKWFFAGQFLGLVTDRIQPWLIKLFISTEAVAIYSIADSMVGIVRKFFPTGTLAAIIPLKVHDKAMARRVLTYGTKYFVMLSLVTGCTALVFAPIVIRTLFSDYAAALPYFYVLLVTLPLNALMVIPGLYVQALRKQKFMFLSDTFKTIVRIPLLLLVLPIFGLWGMIIDKLLITVITSIIFFFYISRMKNDIPIIWNRFVAFDEEDRRFLKAVRDEVQGVLKSKSASFFRRHV